MSTLSLGNNINQWWSWYIISMKRLWYVLYLSKSGYNCHLHEIFAWYIRALNHLAIYWNVQLHVHNAFLIFILPKNLRKSGEDVYETTYTLYKCIQYKCSILWCIGLCIIWYICQKCHIERNASISNFFIWKVIYNVLVVNTA